MKSLLILILLSVTSLQAQTVTIVGIVTDTPQLLSRAVNNSAVTFKKCIEYPYTVVESESFSDELNSIILDNTNLPNHTKYYLLNETKTLGVVVILKTVNICTNYVNYGIDPLNQLIFPIYE